MQNISARGGGVCRLALANCLQSPEGMAALRAELDGGGETDAAMAFLATAIKDHGAVPASNSLFRWGLSQESQVLSAQHTEQQDSYLESPLPPLLLAHCSTCV